ncbi:MAG: DUF262 domain-containing protein [Ignavibacteriaceae bacterium]
MAYQTPITIKEAISSIQKRKFVLPSIQREFVWNTEQIEKLFDSVMREYPISTFLFWTVEKGNIGKFQFYDFLREYHEKNSKHNTKIDLNTDEDVIAILDGQQRLTSFYIGLCGSYASKLPYYHWDNPKAFPKKKLYLNIWHPSEYIELEYEFRFMSEEEFNKEEENKYYEVSEILKLKEISNVMDLLLEKGLTDTSKFSKEQTKFSLNTLTKLFNVIHQKETISYFLEKGEELDKVLQIFIRINSGGEVLTYSDLLLSIATTQWKDKDAREVIHSFVEELNGIGDGFNFDKDFVLKSCLVLGDFTDVKFKVDNFKSENMRKIESLWDNISEALRNTVKLISSFGFNRDNLITARALIPIAYYILKRQCGNKILLHNEFKEDRFKIREWFIRVSLKGTFGGTPDNLYPVLRNLVNENSSSFPLQEIIQNYKGTNKSIDFNEDDVDNILDLDYSKQRTYTALCLLYSGLNPSFRYHKDHIHPKTFFKKPQLKQMGIDQNEIVDEYLDNFNKMPNLQLLSDVDNLEKTDIHFKDWLLSRFSNEQERNTFLQSHFIPNDAPLDFKDFIKFYNLRKEFIREKLKKLLNF